MKRNEDPHKKSGSGAASLLRESKYATRTKIRKGYHSFPGDGEEKKDKNGRKKSKERENTRKELGKTTRHQAPTRLP